MWVLDILVLGTPGPWNPWTLGLLDLFPPPTLPHISPYILLPPPISSYYSPPLVWFGLVWFILMLKRYYILLHSLPLTSSHLLPIPPSYSTLLLTPPTSSRGSYMKRFQCYSARKSFMGGGGWWWWRHCNYSYKLQVHVSY